MNDVSSPSREQVMARIQQRSAVHEAAHAVVALELGWEVAFIETSPHMRPDVEMAELLSGDTWGFTRCSVPSRRRYEIEGVAQALAGYVAEALFVPELLDEDQDDMALDEYAFALEHLFSLREELDTVGDFAGAWELLEFNLDLPTDDHFYGERAAAFEWSARRTCRVVEGCKDAILLVADRVVALAPGAQLLGVEIATLADS